MVNRKGYRKSPTISFQNIFHQTIIYSEKFIVMLRGSKWQNITNYPYLIVCLEEVIILIIEGQTAKDTPPNKLHCFCPKLGIKACSQERDSQVAKMVWTKAFGRAQAPGKLKVLQKSFRQVLYWQTLLCNNRGPGSAGIPVPTDPSASQYPGSTSRTTSPLWWLISTQIFRANNGSVLIAIDESTGLLF